MWSRWPKLARMSPCGSPGLRMTLANCCFWYITTQPGPTCNLTPSLNLMKQMMHKDKGSIPNLAT